jgi:hypothetical protein
MLGEISLLLWVGVLSVAVGLYDITLVKVGAARCCWCLGGVVQQQHTQRKQCFCSSSGSKI